MTSFVQSAIEARLVNHKSFHDHTVAVLRTPIYRKTSQRLGNIRRNDLVRICIKLCHKSSKNTSIQIAKEMLRVTQDAVLVVI